MTPESMFFGEGAALPVLAAALAFDWLLGELPAPLHPVVWMGNAVTALSNLAPSRGSVRQLAAGTLIAVAVPAAFAALTVLVQRLPVWPPLAFAVDVLLLKSMFAVRGLGRAAFRVRDALALGSVAGARSALQSLCSRDPNQLDPPLLIAATVESLAENASDSFVAPLFYYVLFGLPGAVFYRAVNTLDSMIGYRGRYEYLGKASARLDDVLNLIPARITALLVIAGALCTRWDAKRGWAIWRRDRGKTASPNAGHPMAAMAGVLGVQLEKLGCYRLGDAREALGIDTIDRAWRLVLICAGMASAVTALTLGALT
jgi:adenosylcobinamide-phosphate synthase